MSDLSDINSIVSKIKIWKTCIISSSMFIDDVLQYALKLLSVLVHLLNYREFQLLLQSFWMFLCEQLFLNISCKLLVV